MSAQNPFQVPSCFKLDIEQRRRERFKKTVVAAVIVSVALVVGLLIEGCVSEKSASVTPISSGTPGNQVQADAAPATIPAGATLTDSSTVTTTTLPATPAPQTKPTQSPAQSVSVSQATLPLQSCPVAKVPKAATPVATQNAIGGTVYLVKSGDTLTRIAKTHNTTIAALKTANNLANDKISIGEKLKIPSA